VTHPEDNDLLRNVDAWLQAREEKPRIEVLAAIAAICGIVLAFFVLHIA
jgi:hypothetical protein